jgi:hypothetical protein
VTGPEPGPVHGWHDGLPSIEDLTSPPGDPDDAVAEVRHQLGIGAPGVRYSGDLPDAGGLAEGLELA